MILLIDNYDSFSYNLYQFVGTLQPDIKVVRNNELSISQIEELSPTHIILSPGPGTPENAGICIEAAKTLGKRIPMLGVCLGNQSSPHEMQTCDTRRGNADLFVDPRDAAHISQILYRGDGTIYSKNLQINLHQHY